MRRLEAEPELERSSVVASCSMNRERELAGSNGYGRELGVDLVALLGSGRVERWLDLCCGRGRALIEAARRFPGVDILGVDLAGMFDPVPDDGARLTLREAALRELEPPGSWDLTCVHGLHDVGDKLGAIAKAASWLAGDGLLVANLDLANLEIRGASARRRVPRWLRSAGLEYDARRRLVRCQGRRAVDVPWTFAGADDAAGPNYTGQPAVTSHYS